MSIIDIARDANVSISTVSRYFNRPELLSPEVAAKIEGVVAKRNYRPRIVRPGPKANSRIGIRSGVIALVSLTDYSPADMWRMPILPNLIGSVQATLLRKQLSLFLGQLDQNGRLPECVTPRRCDGVIFFSKPHHPETLARFKKNLPELPGVWCFREHADDDGRFDHIFYDNTAVGAIAADYLAERGHRKAAFFSLNPAHTAYPAREKSFLRRAAELGMECKVFAPENQTGFERKSYTVLAQKFLREGKGITGAFFCADQEMLGIYTELLAAGYNAKKLDMIGCNADELILQFIDPRPASIDIKVAQIGQMAVDQLLRRINGDAVGAANEIFVKPELIRGE